MFVLSENIQSERRDCIVYCDNLKIGVRANGEEVTCMIDIAGNLYPAGIPEPTAAPTAANGATNAAFVPDGFYGYKYVYAAKNRYPYLDAGRANAGSIAPRGNPSPSLIHQVTGGPRRVVVTTTGSDRLDIDQIIVYRTVMCASAADAQLFADANQLFAVGLVANVPGPVVFNDEVPISVATEQIEADNFFAPTMQYLAWDGTYLWGIGNDPLIKLVNWASDTVTLDDEGKWFSGRDGQLATIVGITSGGIDGRGTFLFKVIDNNSAYLTIDGTTPATLTPSTGSGYLKVVGPATTLFRSKPRNVLAWGETIIVGTGLFVTLFARKLSGDRATAIAVLPGGEYLKIDVKDVNRTYRFSLRQAGNPSFVETKTEISDTSVSAHFSQFVATTPDGQKVLWGWDADTHSILECDGNSQRIVSQAVFETLRQMQTETSRMQYAHAICNEELELNILWLPWGSGINATDMAIYQHYPSGKWFTALVGDLLSSCSVRDPLTNLIRFLGGRDSGLLVEQQRADLYVNLGSLTHGIESYGPMDNELTLSPFAPSLATFIGYWALWYSNYEGIVKYGRIIGVNVASTTGFQILTFDAILNVGNAEQAYDKTAVLLGDTPIGDTTFFQLGTIPTLLEKVLEINQPTTLKKIKSISLSGKRLLGMRLYLYSPDFAAIERYPNPSSRNSTSDDITSNQGNFRFNKVACPKHMKIPVRIFNVVNGANPDGENLQLRAINLDT